MHFASITGIYEILYEGDVETFVLVTSIIAAMQYAMHILNYATQVEDQRCNSQDAYAVAIEFRNIYGSADPYDE